MPGTSAPDDRRRSARSWQGACGPSGPRRLRRQARGQRRMLACRCFTTPEIEALDQEGRDATGSGFAASRAVGPGWQVDVPLGWGEAAPDDGAGVGQPVGRVERVDNALSRLAEVPPAGE